MGKCLPRIIDVVVTQCMHGVESKRVSHSHETFGWPCVAAKANIIRIPRAHPPLGHRSPLISRPANETQGEEGPARY